jgi:phosphohistidine phosphatase
MNLYIIRHAWAERSGNPKWPDDFQRPLTEKGKRRFAEMACILAERGVEPTLIVTSPMVRCRQTADILAEQISRRVEIAERPELLPDGDVEDLVAWTAEQIAEHQEIAWIGHCPNVNDYTSLLIGLSNGDIRFAKGAAAAIRFENDLVPTEGELQWLLTAKMLGI